MLNCGIYKITNIETGDFYIGQSIHLNRRKSYHFSQLKKDKHRNQHLQNAFNLYGEENFKFEILLYCEPFELTRYEQTLVDKWNPAYNLLTECVNSSKGYKWTEESKSAISGSCNPNFGNSGSYSPIFGIMSGSCNPMFGKTGENHPMFGVHRFGEDAPNYGNHHSEESKIKMSIARKAYWANK